MDKTLENNLRYEHELNERKKQCHDNMRKKLCEVFRFRPHNQSNLSEIENYCHSSIRKLVCVLENSKEIRDIDSALENMRFEINELMEKENENSSHENQ